MTRLAEDATPYLAAAIRVDEEMNRLEGVLGFSGMMNGKELALLYYIFRFLPSKDNLILSMRAQKKFIITLIPFARSCSSGYIRIREIMEQAIISVKVKGRSDILLNRKKALFHEPFGRGIGVQWHDEWERTGSALYGFPYI